MGEGKKGLVLLVHGSRDPRWLQPFEDLAHELQAKSGATKFTIACLQFGAPTLEQAIADLVEEEIGEVVVVPFFLSSLGHVQKDVPALIQAAQAKFSQIQISLTPALGEWPEVRSAIKSALLAFSRAGQRNNFH